MHPRVHRAPLAARSFVIIGLIAGAGAGAVAPALAAPTPPHALAAAAHPDTAVYWLPLETEVTASRQSIPLKLNPAATTVVSGHRLESIPRGVAADEALTGVPGLRVENQADERRVHIAIRGQGVLTESGVRGIKVLLDGLPLNDPSGVAPDLYDVDWSTVERVEVLRGPAGAFYGGGGSGGVLNIVTRDGAEAPGRVTVSGEGGSYGFYKTLTEGAGTIGNTGYRLSYSRAAADGYRQHTAFESDNLYGKLHWKPNERVDFQQVLAWTDHFEENAEGLNMAQVQQDPRQANPDAIPKNEYYQIGRLTAGLTGRWTMLPGQALGIAAFLRDTRYTEPRPSEIIRRQFLSPGVTLQYDLDSELGASGNHLSVGADALWQSVDETRFENLGDAQPGGLQSNEELSQHAEGVFVLDRVTFARDWTLMACGRADAITHHVYDKLDPTGSYDARFDRGTVRTGLAWAASPPLNVYANWASGFLPPATAELQNNPDGFGGMNRALTFATSMGPEIGARGRLGRSFSYELAVYHLATKRDIGRFRLPPSTGRGGIDFYHNVGDTRRDGVETRFDWKPLSHVTTEVAYTWSRFKYVSPDSIDGNWLPSSPEHMLHLGLDVEPLPRFSVGIEGDMQSHWWVDTNGLAWVPGYALWGAHASYHWPMGDTRGELMLAGRNLFGASYMAFTEPDFNEDNSADVFNSYQPGPRQEVFARLSLSR